MSPAVRATLHTTALLAFCAAVIFVGFFDGWWLFGAIMACAVVGMLTLFWKASYDLAKLQQRKKP